MQRTLLSAIAGLVLAAHGAAFADPSVNVPLTDGDFSSPITAGQTGYTIAPCTYGVAEQTCQYAENTVFVNTNPNLDHNLWASFGTGTANPNMLIVNGGADPSLPVWQDNGIAIAADHLYQFTGYAASNYPSNPALLEIAFNGVTTGVPFTVTQVGTFEQFTFDWFSGSATSLNLQLLDVNTVASGNDFSVDDFTLTEVPEPASAAALIVGLTVITVIRLRRRRR